MEEESQKERGTLGESLLWISLLILGVAVLLALFYPVSNGSGRGPMEASYEATMRQLSLAIEIYEKDFGDKLPIRDLEVVGKILAGGNGRGKVYFGPFSFKDQYGRSFVIDKGQIVHLGDDGVLGTDDDIRAVVKRQ